MVDPAASSSLCVQCVDTLDVTGAGIMLMTNAGPRSVLCVVGRGQRGGGGAPVHVG